MAGLLNRDIARQEASAAPRQSSGQEETQIKDLLIQQLQREKAALRQALYEMALELAEARVAAAMQSLRFLDSDDLSTGLEDQKNGE